MSDLDLTAATEAAFVAAYPIETDRPDWSPLVAQTWAEIVAAAAPLIAAQVREQIKETARDALVVHTIECTGLGEVTCRGCRDRGWMSWPEYHDHLAAIISVGGAR